jgi:hypothetical protein
MIIGEGIRWVELALNRKPQGNISKKISVVLRITLCSPVKVKLRFGGTYHLHLQGRKVSQIINRRKAGCFMLVCTQCYIPEDRTLRSYRCQNLKFQQAFLWYVGPKRDCKSEQAELPAT